jgi:uncharacterized protein (TIGR02594 family)
MRRILAAGALLVIAANPANARDRQAHNHATARQANGSITCDEHGCREEIGGGSNFGGSNFGDSLLMLAQSQLGNGAIYGRSSLWCGRFMNWALTHAGYRGTGSDLAKSFLRLPRTTPRVGAIAVFDRGGRFGHVGLVVGFDKKGNPIIISGNHGRRVARGVYPRRRVLAYVSPV